MSDFKPVPTHTGDTLSPENVHILIIEDTMSSFNMMMRMLTYCGVKAENCFWKTNGATAVSWADQVAQHLDLIFLDIKLPYEDGYEVHRKFREHPAFRYTKIVAITGQVAIEDMRKAEDAGFDSFIGKPLTLDRFPDQLKRILNREQVWENKST